MGKPPIKLEGVYARKMDPEKEIINYKSTKIKKMLSIASGGKNENFYEVLYFSENYTATRTSGETVYCAKYSTMQGEIFDLTDRNKGKGCSAILGKNKNVSFDDREFEFESEHNLFHGIVSPFHKGDILTLYIHSKESDKMYKKRLRYIPWF